MPPGPRREAIVEIKRAIGTDQTHENIRPIDKDHAHEIDHPSTKTQPSNPITPTIKSESKPRPTGTRKMAPNLVMRVSVCGGPGLWDQGHARELAPPLRQGRPSRSRAIR